VRPPELAASGPCRRFHPNRPADTAIFRTAGAEWELVLQGVRRNDCISSPSGDTAWLEAARAVKGATVALARGNGQRGTHPGAVEVLDTSLYAPPSRSFRHRYPPDSRNAEMRLPAPPPCPGSGARESRARSAGIVSIGALALVGGAGDGVHERQSRKLRTSAKVCADAPCATARAPRHETIGSDQHAAIRLDPVRRAQPGVAILEFIAAGPAKSSAQVRRVRDRCRAPAPLVRVCAGAGRSVRRRGQEWKYPPRSSPTCGARVPGRLVIRAG
jgi:hypothetical protein